MDDFDKELLDVSGQRSAHWRDIRAGRFTASEIWKLMTRPRNKSDAWSQTAMTYILTKVAEDITGYVYQSSQSYPMVWGEEQEPFAKEYFTLVTGIPIEPCTFFPFTDHAGGSPDGLIPGGIVEIKCPFNPANHIEYLQIKTWEDIYNNWPEYFWQMQANMLFTKTECCTFICYDPRFPDGLKMKTFDLPALPDHQSELVEQLERAIEEKLKLKQQINEGLTKGV